MEAATAAGDEALPTPLPKETTTSSWTQMTKNADQNTATGRSLGQEVLLY